MPPQSDRSAVDKALDLIEAVVSAGEPVRLSAVAATVGLHRATAYRVMVGLVRRGWLVQSDAGYLPGPALPQLSPMAARSTLMVLARPTLEDLAERSDLMVNLQVLEPTGSRVLDVVRPRRLDMIADLSDALLPLGRFAGPTALVALLDEAHRAPYFEAARLGDDPDGISTLTTDIERTLEAGYAIEWERNERVIASMSRAFEAGGKLPDFALTLVGLVSDFSDDALAQFDQWLAGAGEVLLLRIREIAQESAGVPGDEGRGASGGGPAGADRDAAVGRADDAVALAASDEHP